MSQAGSMVDAAVTVMARAIVYGLICAGLIRCGIRRPFRKGVNGSSLRALVWGKRD